MKKLFYIIIVVLFLFFSATSSISAVYICPKDDSKWPELGDCNVFCAPDECFEEAGCPSNQTKPHSACQGGSCVSVDSCGVTNCSACTGAGGGTPRTNQPAFQPAAARPLEITYPEIQGFKPDTTQTDVAKYIRYIYYFLVTIGGLLALGALVYASVRYVTSAGRPEAMNDAKDQIFAALLGLLILLGSWVILNSISPNLVVLRLPLLKPPLTTLSPGVWLCKQAKGGEFSSAWQSIESFKTKEKELETASKENQEAIIKSLQDLSRQTDEALASINKECYLVDSSGNIRRDYDNKVTHVYLVPGKEGNEFRNYGAVLFVEQSFKGKNQIAYTQQIYQVPQEKVLNSGSNAISEPSSIILFNINPNPDRKWTVTAYEEVDSNKGWEEGKKKKQIFPNECSNKGSYWCAGNLNPAPKSIEYNQVKGWITILSKDGSYSSTEVFFTSDSNLLDNELITKQDCTLKFFRCKTLPAATVIFLISGYIY